MAVLAFGSLGHSAGTTTTVTALALHWPRPALMVEADLSSTSSVLAGPLRGGHDHTRGLGPIAMSALTNRATPQQLWEQSFPLEPSTEAQDRRVLPGFGSLGAANGAGDEFWGRLGQLLSPLDSAGTDVLVDLGRINPHEDPRLPLLLASELVTLIVGATLPDVSAVVDLVNQSTTSISALRERMERVGKADALVSVLVDRARENYSSSEVQQVIGVPVVAGVPWAPDAAAVFSLGASAPRRRDGYQRAVEAAAGQLQSLVGAQRARLGLMGHAGAGRGRA